MDPLIHSNITAFAALLLAGRERSIGTGLVCLGAGLFTLFRYGLTREPLYFNEFNPCKKPLPVWAARLVYIPMAIFFLYFGVRALIGP